MHFLLLSMTHFVAYLLEVQRLREAERGIRVIAGLLHEYMGNALGHHMIQLSLTD